MIGVDFSATAIKRARRRAKAAGVEIEFIVDDLTNLRHVEGTFDFLTDFGALNDLNQRSRDLYMENVLPLTHPGSQYLMFSFNRMLSPEEVRRRFEEHFNLEVLETRPGELPGTLSLYLMTRR